MRTWVAGIACALLVAGVCNVSAQTRFGIGLRAGINFGTIAIDPDVYQLTNGVSKTGRTGMAVGALAELEFAKMFAVEFSPTYIMKGGGYQDDKGGTDIVKYNELDLPVLFKVKFLHGMVRPYAFVGPNLGIVLSATRTASPAGGQSQDVDIKDNTSGMDFSLDFGGGAELEISHSVGILLDARYSLGLSDLNKATNVQQGVTVPTVKTKGFQIIAGTIFHI